MKALIMIDVQNDFLPGGSLAVPDSDRIIPVINALQAQFDLVVATQDWHPADHKSFVSNHPGKHAFESIMLRGVEQTLWPDHCVQGSLGAMWPTSLASNKIEAIFRKGTDPEIDSYSAFFDNAQQKKTGLAGYLRDKGVSELYFSGLCTDICVYYSIKDALALGFTCYLIEEACAPLQEETWSVLRMELLAAGVVIL